MKEQWMVYAKKADFRRIAGQYGIDQVTARIIRNRDVREEDLELYLHGSLSDCPSPFLMKDMDETVEILGKKIREEKRIRIIGDYDVDGVCAVYILVQALKRLGGEGRLRHSGPDQRRIRN